LTEEERSDVCFEGEGCDARILTITHRGEFQESYGLSRRDIRHHTTGFLRDLEEGMTDGLWNDDADATAPVSILHIAIITLFQSFALPISTDYRATHVRWMIDAIFPFKDESVRESSHLTPL
jgi:hypothetical protein